MLACQGVRKMHGTAAGIEVLHVQLLDADQMPSQRGSEACWQHRDAILGTLAITHYDLRSRELDVFHPQPQAFEQAHAGAKQEAPDQSMNAVQFAENLRYFGSTTGWSLMNSGSTRYSGE